MAVAGERCQVLLAALATAAETTALPALPGCAPAGLQVALPVLEDLKRLLWGALMGLGPVWRKGANDGYLFRSLPQGSLHAAAGLTAMTAGILLPLPRPPKPWRTPARLA